MRWLKIPAFLKGKIWRILCFFALGWVVTAIILAVWRQQFFGAGENFLVDAFIAWCGELAFFTVIGLAATVISIEKPEDPHAKAFEERLKILFGNQIPQAVLEHNRKTLQSNAQNPARRRATKLEHNRKTLQSNARYSTNGSRKIYIKTYNAD